MQKSKTAKKSQIQKMQLTAKSDIIAELNDRICFLFVLKISNISVLRYFFYVFFM